MFWSDQTKQLLRGEPRTMLAGVVSPMNHVYNLPAKCDAMLKMVCLPAFDCRVQ